MTKIQLDSQNLSYIHDRNPFLASANIEVTELAGGTFWKPYTLAQIEGKEPFILNVDENNSSEGLQHLMAPQSPIDLTEERIRHLGKALGPLILRFSGSWSTRTYYDFDNSTNGVIPEGFEFILTKDQWKKAVEYAIEVNGEILVSVANCTGVHENGVGAWQPFQAAKLFEDAKRFGKAIKYAEFMNEPNILVDMLLPEGYGAKEYGRDADIFATWLKANYPEVKYLGPSAADSPRAASAGGFAALLLSTEDLLKEMKIQPDIYTYHSYNGISERGLMFGVHHPFESVLTEKYLGLNMEDYTYHKALRDKYCPKAALWNSEGAGSACGGNTWEPTFVETFRTLDELCRFAKASQGVVIHNTLASSAYGYLDPETHLPRPQYFGVLLFNKLVGKQVFDTHEALREGAHVYAFSQKGMETKKTYVLLNTSASEELNVSFEGTVDSYLLTSDKLRSLDIYLNGEKLALNKDNTVPELKGKAITDTFTLPPHSIVFLATK